MHFYLHMPVEDPKYIRIKYLRVQACRGRRPEWVDLLQNTLWVLWVTPSWYTCKQPPQQTIRKGGLLQSYYNSGPLVTQMVTSAVLPDCWQFWSQVSGHWALQPSPCSLAEVPPNPNQYIRQQNCRLQCPMGLYGQASTHWHALLYQGLTPQPQLAYAQKDLTVACYSTQHQSRMARKPILHRKKTHQPLCCPKDLSVFRRLSGCIFIMQGYQ